MEYLLGLVRMLLKMGKLEYEFIRLFLFYFLFSCNSEYERAAVDSG